MYVIVSNTQELRKWVNFCLEVDWCWGQQGQTEGPGHLFPCWALRWKSWEVGEVLCVSHFRIEVFPRAFRV